MATRIDSPECANPRQGHDFTHHVGHELSDGLCLVNRLQHRPSSGPRRHAAARAWGRSGTGMRGARREADGRVCRGQLPSPVPRGKNLGSELRRFEMHDPLAPEAIGERVNVWKSTVGEATF